MALSAHFFIFYKRQAVAILDNRKSLLIAFFAISDQYATFNFFSQNGHRWPFWMTENNFQSHFSPIQFNTQIEFFWNFFHKMAAGGYFG